MKISVIQARVVTEEGSIKLTKSVAKQFPIIWDDAHEIVREEDPPICKVRGVVLGEKRIEWLLLYPDEMDGYAWVHWCGFDKVALATPTVIL